MHQRLNGLRPTAVALLAWHDQRLQHAATRQCTRDGDWPPTPWLGSAAPPLVCVARRAQQLCPIAHPPFRPRCRFYGAVRDRFSALLAQPDVSMPALVAQLDALLQVRPHPAAECTRVEHVQSGGVVITDFTQISHQQLMAKSGPGTHCSCSCGPESAAAIVSHLFRSLVQSAAACRQSRRRAALPTPPSRGSATAVPRRGARPRRRCRGARAAAAAGTGSWWAGSWRASSAPRTRCTRRCSGAWSPPCACCCWSGCGLLASVRGRHCKAPCS